MSRSLFRWGFVAAVAGALVLAASLVSLSGASANGATISVGSMEAQAGGIGKVEVNIADVGAPGVGAWTLDVQFDPAVLTGAACTSEQGGGICNAQYDPGVARVVGTNIYGLRGNAALASIGLSCKMVGEYSLEVRISVFVDATPGNPTDIEAKTVNGHATCTEASPTNSPNPTPTPTPPGTPKLPGDANCDGHVNALDAVLA